MRATPTLKSGATYVVNTGNAGTPAINSGFEPNGDGVQMYNSGSSWTANAFARLTAIFEAELQDRIMYKKMYEPDLDGKTIRISNYILKDNGDQIPKDPANTDYQEFLKWESEGNTIGDPELNDNLKAKVDAGTLKIEDA